MTQLRVSALGPLAFWLNDIALDGLDYNKVRALLLLLALQPDQAHTRESLCALLWPESPEKAARNSLSQALTHLRRVIPPVDGEPFLRATTAAVQINPASAITVAVDVLTFESLLAACEAHAHRNWHTCAQCTTRLQQAFALYCGEFLAQFSLPDSAPFEEWVVARREHLHQLALGGLGRQIHAAEWRGVASEAIELARRQVALDPLNEASQRELIRLLARSGQLSAATDQYDNLRRLLSHELGVEPDPASQALLARVNAEDAPKLPGLTAPPLQMPEPPAALIGRDSDLTALTALLREQQARLITITGTAGVGKTRLALALAQAVRFDYSDGVIFLPLAHLSDGDDVMAELAQVFHLPDESATALIDFLKTKHLLLVFDNFEHVVSAADRVAELLTAAPALAVVITSRSPLRLRSERQFSLEPLAQPDAVRLFLERARTVRHDFGEAPEHADLIAELCKQVDGLPLAIELIAAQVDVAAPASLLHQLASHLNSAAVAPRDLPDRHRTLTAAIAWSTRLLTPAQQNAFENLAVFAGGFDRTAASAVLISAGAELPMLVRSSLIQNEGRDRWRMLEPIRQYAENLLVTSGRLSEVRARHTAYFASIAAEADGHLLGPYAAAWMARLEADHANFQAAARWALQANQGETVLRIGIGIFRFWFRRGFWREGLSWMERALSIDDGRAAAAVRVDALRVAGLFADLLSLYKLARLYLEASLSLTTELGDKTRAASVHHNLGMLYSNQGQFAEALAEFDRAVPNRPDNTRRFPWESKADTLLRLGRDGEARALYEQTLALNRRIKDDEGIAHTLRGLAVIACRAGDVELAERFVRENESICARMEHKRGLSQSAQLYGDIARARADLPRARERYLEALEQFDKMGDSWGRCNVQAALGQVMAALGDAAQARQCFAAAQAGWQSLGAKLTPYEEDAIRATLSRLSP